MGILDELRDALISERSSFAVDGGEWDAVMVEDVDRVFDTFEAEHPGLVDTTVHCENCHQPFAKANIRTIMTVGPTGTHYQATLCTPCANTLDMQAWYGFTNEKQEMSTKMRTKVFEIEEAAHETAEGCSTNGGSISIEQLQKQDIEGWIIIREDWSNGTESYLNESGMFDAFQL